MVSADSTREFIGGTIGTCISAIPLSNVEDIQSAEGIVSIICTVLGLVITIIACLIIPLLRWRAEAKKDGKIDDKEMAEGAEILNKGLEDLKDNLENLKDKDKKDKGGNE